MDNIMRVSFEFIVLDISFIILGFSTYDLFLISFDLNSFDDEDIEDKLHAILQV